MFIVRIQIHRVFFACPKTLSNLSADVTTNMFNASPCVKCALLSLKNKQNRFSWSLARGFRFLKRRKNQFKMLMVICLVLEGTDQDKSVSMSIQGKKKMEVVTNVLNGKRVALWTFFKDKIPKIVSFASVGMYCFVRRLVVTTKSQNNLPFKGNFSANRNSAQPNLRQKRKKIHLRHNRSNSILVDAISQKISCYTVSVYSKATWISQSLATPLSSILSLDRIHSLCL